MRKVWLFNLLIAFYMLAIPVRAEDEPSTQTETGITQDVTVDGKGRPGLSIQGYYEYDYDQTDDSCEFKYSGASSSAFSTWNYLKGSVKQELPVKVLGRNFSVGSIELIYSNFQDIPEAYRFFDNKWSLSLCEYVVISSDKMTYIKGIGARYIFEKQEDGTYKSYPSKVFTASLIGSEYVIKKIDGSKRYFAKSNKSNTYALSKVVEPDRVPVLLEYTDKGSLSNVSYGSKEHSVSLLKLNYNDSNRVSSVVDAAGKTIFSAEYSNNYLSTVKYPELPAENNQYTFSYDDKGLLNQKVRPNKGIVRYFYDDKGRLIAATDALGKLASVKFGRNQITVKNRNGEINSFKTESDYPNYVEAIYPTGKTAKRKLDDKGRIIEKYGDCASCDGISATTKYKYDDNNNLVKISYFSGDNLTATEQFKYDNKRRQIESVDRNGAITKFVYDSEDNLVKTIYPDNSNTLNVYQNSLLVSQTDELGNTTKYEYDNTGNQISRIMPDGSKWAYEYDIYGHMVYERSPSGMISVMSYDSFGNLYKKVGPVGDITHDGRIDHADIQKLEKDGYYSNWVYDIQNNLLASRDSNGNVTKHEYDLQWKLNKTIFPDHSYEQLWRDNAGRVTKNRNRDGSYRFTTYNATGNVIKQIWDDGKVIGKVDPEDSYTQNFYDNNGKLTSTRDRNGNVSSMEYDEFGRVVKRIDAVGNITKLSYDLIGNVVSQIDPMGRETKSEYDQRNRLVKRIDPAGNEMTYSYDAAGNILTTTAPNGMITKNLYDKMNRLVETVVDANGLRITSGKTYAADGKILSTVIDKGRSNLVTKYEYDDFGRLSAVISPDGIRKISKYDENGNNVENIVAAGNISISTHTVYDKYSRAVKRISPAGIVTEIKYDESGRQNETVLDPDGINLVIKNEFDNDGRVIKTYLDFGGQLQSESIREYDNNGNVIRQVGPAGITTIFSYDELNRQISSTNNLGFTTKNQFNKSGQLIAKVDQNGKSKSTQYNELGKAIKQLNQMNQPVSYTYDATGNRLTLTDANGNTSSWIYDSLNRPISLTYPNGDKESYSYNRLGRMTSKTYPDGQKISFEYDKGGRITSIMTPNGSLTFRYDALGRKIEEIDNTLPNGIVGRVNYGYNDLGQLTSVTDHNLKQTIKYEYDTLGRRSAVTASGNTIHYRYNRKGQLSEVQKDSENASTHYEYDLSGRRTKISLPNGVVTKYTYDKAGRLTGVVSTDPSGKTISGTEYTLDPTGNRTAMKLTLDGTVQNIQYCFDNAYRLTAEERTDSTGKTVYTDNFKYDALGNRIERSRMMDGKAVVATKYTYNDANQLITESSEGITKTYSYDKNGNNIAIVSTGKEAATVKMTYDWLNRMVSWSDGKNTETQIYRGYSWKRIATIIDTAEAKHKVVKYLYDGSNIIADFDNADSQTAFYVTPMLDQNLSMSSDGKTYYYTQDGLGSVRTLTDQSGKLVNKNDYYAFGEVNKGSTKDIIYNRYTYTGREKMLSDFLYYRHRVYAPGLSRFSRRDPALMPMNNLYLLASNNPCLYQDPFGLWKSIVGLNGTPTGSYVSDSKSDTLQSLAVLAGGTAADWACLWPILNTKDHGYASGKVRLCDVYDASNLSTNSLSNSVYINFIESTYDDYLEDRSQANDLKTGAAVLDYIKSKSQEGGAPITYFEIYSHGTVGNPFIGPSVGGEVFDPAVQTLMAPITPSFTRAQQQKGPYRCWFSKNAKTQSLACHGNKFAEKFAEYFLRAPDAYMLSTTREAQVRVVDKWIDANDWGFNYPLTGESYMYSNLASFLAAPIISSSGVNGWLKTTGGLK